MDRRDFLKGLAALGLISSVDVERALAQPEPVEPSPLFPKGTRPPSVPPDYASVEVGGHWLAAREVTVSREHTSWPDDNSFMRHSPIGPSVLTLVVAATAGASALFNECEAANETLLRDVSVHLPHHAGHFRFGGRIMGWNYLGDERSEYFFSIDVATMVETSL